MAKYKKHFGENPEDIVVLSSRVSFDEFGLADVEDEDVISVLEAVPGYERVEEGEYLPQGEEEPETGENEPVDAPSNEEDAEGENEPEEEPVNGDEETSEDEIEEEEEEEQVVAPIKRPRARKPGPRK